MGFWESRRAMQAILFSVRFRGMLFGLFALVFAISVGTADGTESAKGPSTVILKPGLKQLFLDDYVVDKLSGVRRTMHQLDKQGAVLWPELSWEMSNLETRNTPYWNPQRCRWELYYFAWNRQIMTDHAVGLVASADGLNWYRPILGLIEVNGSTQNNIVGLSGDDFLLLVLYDLLETDSNRRWKAMMGDRNPRPAASANGLNWQILSETQIVSGEEGFLIYDKLSEQFLYSLRTVVDMGYGRHRAVNLSTSTDFVNWSEPELIFYADGLDQQLGEQWILQHLADPNMRQPQVNDPSQYNTQIYNMGIFPYEGLYIGLPTMFRHTGDNDGFSVTALAMSRDLRNWSRLGERATFIPLSPVAEGVYDNAQIEPPSRAVRRGDELWFYYTGLKYRLNPPPDDSMGAICLAKLRLDGFVSLDASQVEGTVLTRPLKWCGSTLWVNTNACGGEFRAEILDKNGKLLNEKFSRRQAIMIDNDGIKLPVRWKTGSDLRELEGKTVRLRFYLRNTSLYAFWTE